VQVDRILSPNRAEPSPALKQMAEKEKTYRRLRGKKKGFIGLQTLWMGPDHLLLIDSKRVTEDYKRFYYEDIQRFIVQKTHRGKILNLLTGSGFLTMGFWACQSDGPVSILLGLVAASFLIGLLYNLFLGPTGLCAITTAVQTEALPSLNRVRNAHRAIERLRPRIEDAQGVITEIPGTIDPQASVKSFPDRPPLLATKKRYEKGAVHRLLFLLLFADAAATTAAYLDGHIGITLLHMGISLAMAIVVIIAIVRQHGSAMPQSIKSITWSALVYTGISWVAGYAIYVAALVKNPALLRSGNQWEQLKYISTISLWESSWHTGVYAASVSVALILGISGLLLLLHYCSVSGNWRDSAKASSMPPPPLGSTV
jgi:hypothetical protein